MRPALLLILACAACADAGTLTRPDTSAAQMENDSRECHAQMYAQRTAKGRGAPNWLLYDYCMKSRGYAPAKGA